MSTPASFSCATSETDISVNAMSDLVRRQVAIDDVEKYNLPWLYTYIPIKNGLHRASNGDVLYYAGTGDVQTALKALVHEYTTDGVGTGISPQTLEAFKLEGDRELASVLRQYVLFPMYDEKIDTTAFDLDKVQHIFRDESELAAADRHPSAQGWRFFTDTQLGEIVDDFVSGDRPVMIQVPSTETDGNANKYYFPEPDAGDVIGIVVHCADNSSDTSGDVIYSKPQRFVMCMILQDGTTPSVGWQSSASNPPTLAEVTVGVDNTVDPDYDIISSLGTAYITTQENNKTKPAETTAADVAVARDNFINGVTAAITILSAQYHAAPADGNITEADAYTAMVTKYVDVTGTVYDEGATQTTYDDHKAALQARVDEKDTLSYLDEKTTAEDALAAFEASLPVFEP